MDDFFCSFCGKRKHEVRKLISGPRVFICNECVALCREIVGPRRSPAAGDVPPERTTGDMPAEPLPHDEDVTAETKPPDEKSCSFCRRLQADVAKLVNGPTVHICTECVDLCEDILAAERELSAPQT